jgi:hypothetical protein
MERSVFAYYSDEPCGRIVGTRLDFIAAEDLDERFLHVVLPAEAATAAPSDSAGTCVVIERAVPDPTSADVVTRMYTCAQSVVDFLVSVDDPTVAEDAEVVRLVVAATTISSAHKLNIRKIRPLAQENALLRAALGLSRSERVSVSTLKRGKQQQQQHRHHANDGEQSLGGAKAASPAPYATEQQDACTQTGEAPTDVCGDKGDDALSIHSPLLWEQETLAAVNARTKYSPFVKRHQEGARRLDFVTQQNLVSRLHDQCVDERQRKMLLNEEKVLRDLGLYERRVLSTEEQLELGARLHDRQRQHTSEMIKKLTAAFHGDASPPRTLTPSELQESVERIYKQPMEKAKSSHEKLFQMYVLDEEAKYAYAKLTVEQQAEVATRLSKR